MPFALDYGAVMLVGRARGVDLGLLADAMPGAERAIMAGQSGGSVDEEEAEA